jgi:hypothetical protein
MYPSKFSYAYYAMFHGGWKDASLEFHRVGNCAHALAIFPPWHREYLRQFEEGLNYHLPGFKLPYIDWTICLERGLPEYFRNPTIMSDYNDNTPENIELYHS